MRSAEASVGITRVGCGRTCCDIFLGGGVYSSSSEGLVAYPESSVGRCTVIFGFPISVWSESGDTSRLGPREPPLWYANCMVSREGPGPPGGL